MKVFYDEDVTTNVLEGKPARYSRMRQLQLSVTVAKVEDNH